MHKNESWFWGKIRDNLPLDWIKRVENKVEPGWPDAHYMNNEHPGWIELKYEDKFPGSAKGRIDFEPGQPLWLSNYWAMGGTCFVFLYVAKDNEIYVWLGYHARELNEPGGPSKIPPYMKVKMDARGWQELYQLFSVEKSNVEFLSSHENL